MGKVVIRRGTRADSKGFLGLVGALANFEHLRPPSEAGKKRMTSDIFEKKRIHLTVAAEGKNILGYALYFYTYSSFLAKPSLYLEDLFVLEEYRRRGIGFDLFRWCVNEAVRQGCGRMEWAVLTWNSKAIGFYEKLGARRLDEWYVYRLDEDSLRRVPRSTSM
jgi:GNAT superfamily N-acetyltransferase